MFCLLRTHSKPGNHMVGVQEPETVAALRSIVSDHWKSRNAKVSRLRKNTFLGNAYWFTFSNLLYSSLYFTTDAFTQNLMFKSPVLIRVYISGVTKSVTKFLTLSQWGGFDSVKNFVTLEIWTLRLKSYPSWQAWFFPCYAFWQNLNVTLTIFGIRYIFLFNCIFSR